VFRDQRQPRFEICRRRGGKGASRGCGHENSHSAEERATFEVHGRSRDLALTHARAMALKIILRQQAEYDTCSRRREDNAKGIFVNSGNTLVASQRIGWNGNNLRPDA
jgi:hypothetical protein